MSLQNQFTTYSDPCDKFYIMILHKILWLPILTSCSANIPGAPPPDPPAAPISNLVYIYDRVRCPDDGEVLSEPEIECEGTSECYPYETDGEFINRCNDETGWCCLRLPLEIVENNSKCDFLGSYLQERPPKSCEADKECYPQQMQNNHFYYCSHSKYCCTHPPLAPSATSTESTPASSSNASLIIYDKVRCPDEGTILMQPELNCGSDYSLCEEDNDLYTSCHGRTQWCCQKLPKFDLTITCAGTSFILEKMEKCANFLLVIGSSGTCLMDKTHKCQDGRCCPNVVDGDIQQLPPKMFNSRIPCGSNGGNDKGIFCKDGTLHYVGQIDVDGHKYGLTKKCQSESECEKGYCVNLGSAFSCLEQIADDVPTTTEAPTTPPPSNDNDVTTPRPSDHDEPWHIGPTKEDTWTDVFQLILLIGYFPFWFFFAIAAAYCADRYTRDDED